MLTSLLQHILGSPEKFISPLILAFVCRAITFDAIRLALYQKTNVG